MFCFRRLCVSASVSAALTLFSSTAWAQSHVTYSVAGVEIAATSTEGTFTGVAVSSDDFASWAAVIQHEELDDTASIIGGTLAFNGGVRDLQGIFTGGEIVRVTGSCRKETFTVTGDLLLVGGGSGEFNVTLTHYGRRVPGGNCVTFFATVEGLVTFTLPSQ
jgi:CBS domain-containing protein